jgi:glycosyltransferase involved in cell wall biosynthesis
VGLKIAVWYNLPTGGSKRALYQHVKGLIGRGHYIEAWRPPFPDSESKQFAPIHELVREHEVALPDPGPSNRWLQRIAGQAASSIHDMRQMELHSEEVVRQISNSQFDVVFANTCLRFHAPFIARNLSTPSLLYLNEPQRYYYEALPSLRWKAPPKEFFKNRSPSGLKAILRDAINIQSDRVEVREETLNATAFGTLLVNSNFSRESILRAYGINSTVCYLGIDTEKFVDLGLEREPFLISLGSLTPTKKVEFIIRALGKVKANRPPLVWVGNAAHAPYVNRMRELAAELGVDFRPKELISDNELVNLLNRASLMVYAPHLEPFGLAPLEANACACPVLAVCEGGVKETIIDGQNGRFADPDEEAFGAAIAEMMEDPVSLRQMGQEAKRMAHAKWTLDAATKRLEGYLIREAAKGSRK